MEKIKLEKGRRYRVAKEGGHLSGWKPSGPWCQTGCRVNLQIGDELEYIGMHYSGGSDGIDVHQFRLVSRDDPSAPYCFDFKPCIDPSNWWNSNPHPDYLEAVEERTPA